MVDPLMFRRMAKRPATVAGFVATGCDDISPRAFNVSRARYGPSCIVVWNAPGSDTSSSSRSAEHRS